MVVNLFFNLILSIILEGGIYSDDMQVGDRHMLLGRLKLVVSTFCLQANFSNLRNLQNTLNTQKCHRKSVRIAKRNWICPCSNQNGQVVQTKDVENVSRRKRDVENDFTNDASRRPHWRVDIFVLLAGRNSISPPLTLTRTEIFTNNVESVVSYTENIRNEVSRNAQRKRKQHH